VAVVVLVAVFAGVVLGARGARLSHCQARGYPAYTVDSHGLVACSTAEPPSEFWLRYKICDPTRTWCYPQHLSLR
jgi:hypothetical protein